MSHRLTNVVRTLAFVSISLTASGLLGGCAAVTTGSSITPNLTFSGKVMGGSQVIGGASVTSYATGTTGYGSAATVLGTATTGSTGSFTITSNGNTCADPQQVYLVVSGGNTGSGGNNTASVLVEALGACSKVGASTTGLLVNELTTVAAAYALQGFADTTINIGTTSTNTQGLAHAFANAANIATPGGGARSTTVSGNGAVPAALLNTVANTLSTCVNSSGPSSTGCTAVLLGAPSVVGAAAPANVWQEALDIARYPAYQTAALYQAGSSASAYQSTLSAAPNDFSLGIAYSAGLETDGATAATFPWDIKADSYDNIWVTGMTKAGLVELSPVGALLSPSAGGWGNATLQAAFTHGLAIDTTASGNIWAADNAGNIWEYTPAGTAAAPTAGTTTQVAETTVIGPIGLGIDSANNVWFGTYSGTASASQGIGEVASGSSTATFPANSAYSSTATKGTYTLFVDAANSNRIYAGSQSAGVVYQYLSTAAPTATTSLGTSATNGLAVDKTGALWVVYTGSGSNGGSLSKYTAGATAATITCKATVPSGGAGLYNPRGLVIDGANRMFITSYTTPGIVPFDPSLGTACDSANDAGTFFLNASGNAINPVNSAGTAIIAVSAARNETIDSSGALWTINGASTAGYQPVVQILGLAAPVNPVLAAGKYGVKP